MTAPLKKQNKIGQAMGAKGKETYQSIISSTMALLAKTPYMELSAADVARSCGLTPPALYLYFNGIPEIVLARLGEIKTIEHPYLQHLAALPEAGGSLDLAKAFLHAYVDYWTAHGVALRYRNFMSEQGDKRFQDARTSMSLPLAETFAKRVARGRLQGTLPPSLKPFEAAAAIMALIDHLAGVLTAPIGKWHNQPLRRESSVEAAALMMSAILQGPAAAGATQEGARSVVGGSKRSKSA